MITKLLRTASASGAVETLCLMAATTAATAHSWAIPSGVGSIRNMWVSREGNPPIHQSSATPSGW